MQLGIGVSFEPRSSGDDYRVRLQAASHKLYIGRFRTAHEARLAYDLAVTILAPVMATRKSLNYAPGRFVYRNGEVESKAKGLLLKVLAEQQSKQLDQTEATSAAAPAAAAVAPTLSPPIAMDDDPLFLEMLELLPETQQGYNEVDSLLQELPGIETSPGRDFCSTSSDATAVANPSTTGLPGAAAAAAAACFPVPSMRTSITQEPGAQLGPSRINVGSANLQAAPLLPTGTAAAQLEGTADSIGPGFPMVLVPKQAHGSVTPIVPLQQASSATPAAATAQVLGMQAATLTQATSVLRPLQLPPSIAAQSAAVAPAAAAAAAAAAVLQPPAWLLLPPAAGSGGVRLADGSYSCWDMQLFAQHAACMVMSMHNHIMGLHTCHEQQQVGPAVLAWLRQVRSVSEISPTSSSSSGNWVVQRGVQQLLGHLVVLLLAPQALEGGAAAAAASSGPGIMVGPAVLQPRPSFVLQVCEQLSHALMLLSLAASRCAGGSPANRAPAGVVGALLHAWVQEVQQSVSSSRAGELVVFMVMQAAMGAR